MSLQCLNLFIWSCGLKSFISSAVVYTSILSLILPHILIIIIINSDRNSLHYGVLLYNMIPPIFWEFEHICQYKQLLATDGIILTNVYWKEHKWPFLGVNDNFLGKCSLIVGDDQFWGISAHLLGGKWSLFGLSDAWVGFLGYTYKSTKKSWHGSDPPPFFGNARIFTAPITAAPP